MKQFAERVEQKSGAKILHCIMYAMLMVIFWKGNACKVFANKIAIIKFAIQTPELLTYLGWTFATESLVCYNPISLKWGLLRRIYWLFSADLLILFLVPVQWQKTTLKWNKVKRVGVRIANSRIAISFANAFCENPCIPIFFKIFISDMWVNEHMKLEYGVCAGM